MPYWLHPNARTLTIEALRPGILTVDLLDSYELGRTMEDGVEEADGQELAAALDQQTAIASLHIRQR